ncbi:MAG: aconitate hydratase AcnA, partial [Gammaproteobacteria bacterium]
TGRTPEQIALVEAYARAQGLFREPGAPDAVYSDLLELDMSTVEPSLAGPRRPQDRVPLRLTRQSLEEGLRAIGGIHADPAGRPRAKVNLNGVPHEINDGAVVIAAITSCTNTSNPAVLIAGGLLAKKAVARGLRSKPWVKTSLAPGSRVVTEYLRAAGLLPHLEALGFHVVGYGCTTCIGNSGPLPETVSRAIHDHDLAVCAVLSGNRNFEGRIHPEVKMNYLASPPLVVAYALAGRMDIDLASEPLGTDANGAPVWLRDIWPSRQEVNDTLAASIHADMFRRCYGDLYQGDRQWNELPAPTGALYAWDEDSTYVKHPPYFAGIQATPAPVRDIHGARVLAVLGDSVTTDHISPAGAIKPNSPAGRYLLEHGVAVADFNSYGARRGNHEVMMRGTFANIRLRNRMVPGVEGGVTVYLPDGERMSIYDAAMRYKDEGVPLIILAGKEYGSGSSRDWAAKGPRLLGVRAVIAESYERIHRANLVGMGILPLQFREGESADTLGLTGTETYDLTGLGDGSATTVTVTATAADGRVTRFTALVRIDTPQEIEYYRHGGILDYVLRQLLARSKQKTV